MFEKTMKELRNDPIEKRLMDQLFHKRMSVVLAKNGIVNTALWAKSMAKKARDQNKEAFAAQLDQVAIDLTDSYTSFTEMERELTALRERVIDLEVKEITQRSIIKQHEVLIGNMERELGIN